MAKYDNEKNLPITEFLADSSNRADGLNGPEEILKTLIEIIKMFDPSSTHCDAASKGGISADNLRDGIIMGKHLSEELVKKFSDINSELTFLLESLEYDEDVIDEIENLISGLILKSSLNNVSLPLPEGPATINTPPLVIFILLKQFGTSRRESTL